MSDENCKTYEYESLSKLVEEIWNFKEIVDVFNQLTMTMVHPLE